MKKRLFLMWLMLGVLLLSLPAIAQDSGAAIRQVMDEQTHAWNRGDIAGFMGGYKDAPDTTFIGSEVQHGFGAILARYRAKYASPEAMGKLSFSAIDVRLLDEKFAIATGRFHLERTAAGGGPASGVFSLVWEKTDKGWKAILDHTSQGGDAKGS